MINTEFMRNNILTFGLELVSEKAILELLDHLEAAEKDVVLKERVIDALGAELNAVTKERDELQAKITEMQEQKPVGTLHDDGYFVWRKGYPYESNYAGWKMALYSLPGAKGEEK